VYLRAGHRRPAVAHLIRAAARGQASAVARVVLSMSIGRLARRFPSLRPRQGDTDSPWIVDSETWISQLRGADLATG
jgi:hypothetical protein